MPILRKMQDQDGPAWEGPEGAREPSYDGMVDPNNPPPGWIPPSEKKQTGQSETSPREEQDVRLREMGSLTGSMGGTSSAPPMPRSPSPMAGSTFSPGMAGAGGIAPFAPMTSPSPARLVGSKGMFGGKGGLTGGGFGMMGPQAGAQNESIESLLQLLSQLKG
jgi:hypothetical protein